MLTRDEAHALKPGDIVVWGHNGKRYEVTKTFRANAREPKVWLRGKRGGYYVVPEKDFRFLCLPERYPVEKYMLDK